MTSLPEKAEEAKQKYGTEDSKVYTSYKELLADASIDVIHVCTPNDSHAEISIAALEAGKHVLCEKPMAKTAADARLMLEASKRTGKKLSIGYNNRYRADSRYLKDLAAAGELGESILPKRMRFVAVPFRLGACSWTRRNKAEDR